MINPPFTPMPRNERDSILFMDMELRKRRELRDEEEENHDFQNNENLFVPGLDQQWTESDSLYVPKLKFLPCSRSSFLSLDQEESFAGMNTAESMQRPMSRKQQRPAPISFPSDPVEAVHFSESRDVPEEPKTRHFRRSCSPISTITRIRLNRTYSNFV